MAPLVGCSNPATKRSVVVLPQPEGPRTEKNSRSGSRGRYRRPPRHRRSVCVRPTGAPHHLSMGVPPLPSPVAVSGHACHVAVGRRSRLRCRLHRSSCLLRLPREAQGHARRNLHGRLERPVGDRPTGSSRAICTARAVQQCREVMANSAASSSTNSPDAVPPRTMSVIVPRQWASNSSRTRATSGGAPTGPTGRATAPTSRGARRPPRGRHVMATISSNRPAALSMTSIRRAPRSYQEVLGETHRLGQQVVLGGEVVDDQGRTRPRLLGHVGDPGLGESPLGDDLERGPQHRLAAQVGGASGCPGGFRLPGAWSPFGGRAVRLVRHGSSGLD